MTKFRRDGLVDVDTRAEPALDWRKDTEMPFAADYPFLEVTWTIFIFFAWVMVISFVIMVLIDNFRRTDHSGWAKAGWTLLVIVVPLIGALIYQIARPHTAGEAWDQSGASAARDDMTRTSMGMR
jgi:predicted membrane channel-forming protein YqfA (hemolysin III family)